MCWYTKERRNMASTVQIIIIIHKMVDMGVVGTCQSQSRAFAENASKRDKSRPKVGPIANANTPLFRVYESAPPVPGPFHPTVILVC
jgi:hypothetical protein